MKTIKLELLSVAAAGLFAGAAAAGTSTTPGTGSTDIYANRFAASFGPASRGSVPSVSRQPGVGSTDIYANQFRQSFGEPGPAVTASYARGETGSTDIWGNDFQRSFGSAASQAPITNAATGSARTNEEIRSEVIKQINLRSALRVFNIDVQHFGQDVYLYGVVDSRMDSEQAETIANSVPGVEKVYNELMSSGS